MAELWSSDDQDQRRTVSRTPSQQSIHLGNSNTSTKESDQACNSFYRVCCRYRHLKYIEEQWLPGIHDEIRNFKGFRHRLVIPPTVVNYDEESEDELEYIVILYFSGICNLRSWAASLERQYWVNEGKQRGFVVGSLVDNEAEVDGNDVTTHDQKTGTSAFSAIWTKSNPTQIELHHDSLKSAPKAMPPPKYKLFFVIWSCVFIANLANAFAGDKYAMMRAGIPFSAATFIELCHCMPVIIYALAPLIMSFQLVARWMKAKRCAPEDMSPLHRLLDQGLEIFAAANKEKIPPEVTTRLDRLEGRVERLKRVNHELLQLIDLRSDFLCNTLRQSFPSHPTLHRLELPNEREKVTLGRAVSSSDLGRSIHSFASSQQLLPPTTTAAAVAAEEQQELLPRPTQPKQPQNSSKKSSQAATSASSKSTSTHTKSTAGGINALDPALLQMQQYKAARSSPPLPPKDPTTHSSKHSNKHSNKHSSNGNSKRSQQSPPTDSVQVQGRQEGMQGRADKGAPPLSLPPPLNPVTIPGTGLGSGLGLKSGLGPGTESALESGLGSEGLGSADVDDVGLLIDSDNDDNEDHHDHDHDHDHISTTILSTLPLSWSEKSKDVTVVRVAEEGVLWKAGHTAVPGETGLGAGLGLGLGTEPRLGSGAGAITGTWAGLGATTGLGTGLGSELRTGSGLETTAAAAAAVEKSDHWVLGRRYTARLKGDDSDGGDDDGDVDIEEGINGGWERGEEEDGVYYPLPLPLPLPPAVVSTSTSSVRVTLVGEAVQQWLAHHPEDRNKVDSKGRLAVVEVRGKTVAQEHGQGLGPRSRSTFDLESQTEYKNYVAQELESKPLTMCVTHYVRWERTLAFESWIQDMFNTMSTFPGFIGQNTTPPVLEEDPYVNAFTFESYDDLYRFLSSKERRRLMRDLQPLLIKSSVAQISDERIVHDAFGELFVATGGLCSTRPPPLWKITVLTVVSLQLIVWPISGTLGPFLSASGYNLVLVLFICSFLNVLANTYLGLPLMQFFFGDWLRLPRPNINEMGAFHALLDAGVLVGWSSAFVMVLRTVLILAYFGILTAYGVVLMGQNQSPYYSYPTSAPVATPVAAPVAAPPPSV